MENSIKYGCKTYSSTNDTGEIRTLYVNSDNEEIRFGNET